LHQWERFRRAERPQKGRNPPEPVTAVHQCWQLDFKTGIALANGTLVNLHSVWDPFGEACLMAVVYPAGQVGQAPKGNRLTEARATLRRCFARWETLPDKVQTDGESTISAQRRWNDFPTLFTLWLVGLGIEHRIIRLGRPTDNAQVERGHRTITDYAIVGNENCDVDPLQSILDQAVDELLFDLPSRATGCQGRTPIEAHPDLLQPPRPYQPELEWAQFDLNRVSAYLANLKWIRKTSKIGQLYLGDQRYYLGTAYAHREIAIRFDPVEQKLIFLDPQRPEPEQEIRRLPIKGLSAAEILGLHNPDFKSIPQQLPLPSFALLR
jgi:transposase InsO family protein